MCFSFLISLSACHIFRNLIVRYIEPGGSRCPGRFCSFKNQVIAHTIQMPVGSAIMALVLVAMLRLALTVMRVPEPSPIVQQVWKTSKGGKRRQRYDCAPAYQAESGLRGFCVLREWLVQIPAHGKVIN